MLIYPAIDLKNGNAVRLYQGDYNQETIYGNPLEIAKEFEKYGLKYLHLVDLDGAKNGVSRNIDIISSIVKETNLSVEVGGGIRTLESIETLLNIGVQRVILGSIAVSNINIVKEAINKFGSDKIVVGVDALNFTVRTDGWLKDSKLDALAFCKKLEQIGVKNVIFTDISKDGTLNGFNVEQTQILIDNTDLNIVASGGVKSISDLDNAFKINASAIIVGKAIYSKQISLEELRDYKYNK